MFRGNHPAKVDEKGRLKLPAAFKQLLDAENVSEFYITSTDGESAEIWPLSEWERREKVLAGFTDDVAVAKYLKLTGYYGQQVELDNQARVLLPQILRGTAKLDADVTVIGKLTFLEVHNRSTLELGLPASTMSPQDHKDVAAKLSPRNTQ